MAARKLWKGEKAIPKNREPLKKKEWPPRPTSKKKEWPQKEEPLPIIKGKQPIAERRKGKPVPPPPPKRVKPAPRRSPTLKWNIKKR